MRERASALYALLSLSVLVGCQAAAPPAEPAASDPASLLAALSDDDLLRRFRTSFADRHDIPREGPDRLEFCLWEMCRRRSPVFIAPLEDALKEIRGSIADADRLHRASLEDPSNRPRFEAWLRAYEEADLEVLTALRRLQGRPDPLDVRVKDADRVSIFPRLPLIEATVVNLDSEIRYTRGGDYRSGRWARWRFEVRDAEGRLLPMIESYGSGIGGGMFSRDPLQPGDRWVARLDMDRYVGTLPPGRYTAVAQYSDTTTIADRTDLRGRIVSQSAPFAFTVVPNAIDRTAEERRQIRRWIAELGEAGPLKVLEGSYTEQHHDFIRPDSAPGKLLRMGWKAVLDLIGALEDAAGPKERAWMLSLLFTTTRIENPLARTTTGAAAADCDYRKAAWSLFDPEGGGGILFAEPRDQYEFGEPSVEAQALLVERWRAWGRLLTVRER